MEKKMTRQERRDDDDGADELLSVAVGEGLFLIMFRDIIEIYI